MIAPVVVPAFRRSQSDEIAAALAAFKAAGGVVARIEAGVSGRSEYRAKQDAVRAIRSVERFNEARAAGATMEEAVAHAYGR